MNIKHAHRWFLRECCDGTLCKRSEVTIANYKTAIRLLLKWFPIVKINELHDGILKQFFQKGERVRKWESSTVVTYRKNLKPFLDWCVHKRLLSENPLHKIPSPKILKKIPEIYTEKEIEKFLYVIGVYAHSEFEKVRNTAIIAVLLMTGLRKSELMGLKISDIDFVTHCIRVRAETAKNRMPRVVKMTYRLHEILSEYWKMRHLMMLETNGFWVSSTTKKTLTKDGLKHIIKKLSKISGIRMRSHKCRHTFATSFYQGSKDLVSLQQILGHRDITTTMIYTQVIPENTVESLEKNPLNHLF